MESKTAESRLIRHTVQLNEIVQQGLEHTGSRVRHSIDYENRTKIPHRVRPSKLLHRELGPFETVPY